ncbi:hypothetical protein [Cardiobacterium hominis]|nr:hypothetical protein [Cardiobacterium hominis]
MKNNLNIENINTLEEIVMHYFHNGYKLYSTTSEEIDKFKGLFDTKIIYIFNNRTWIEVWKQFNFTDVNNIINDYPSLFGFFKYFFEIKECDMIKNKMVITDFIFYFTGLFYLGSVVEAIHGEGWFTILEFLDPKNDLEEYYYTKLEIKDFFPSLVERYSPEQLFLISILFIHLPDFSGKSKFGIKYWTWIYENTDNDIREKIMKQFNEKI